MISGKYWFWLVTMDSSKEYNKMIFNEETQKFWVDTNDTVKFTFDILFQQTDILDFMNVKYCCNIVKILGSGSVRSNT